MKAPNYLSTQMQSKIDVPRYIISLDKKPEERWNQVIKDYKHLFPKVIETIDDTFSSMGSIMGSISKHTSLLVVNLYEKTGSIMYKKELRSISEQTGISLGKLILMQLCYEMAAACTSVVFEHEDSQGNKSNIHYRTMDWSMPILKQLTIEAEFQKNGKTLFIAPTWAGYVGVMTAMVPSKFSVALNYRRSNGTLLGNIKKTMNLAWPIGYLIRNTLESSKSYEEAFEIFATTKLISPCYITLCKNKQKSCVIIRDDKKTVIVIPNVNHIVQTNADPDESAPECNILYSYERRCLANKIIKNDINKWKTYLNIYDSFNKYPIINDETVYTTIMHPEKSKIITQIP